VWYYHAVVFIESLAFTRRLQQLEKDDAVAVLTSIQSDLLANPERGRLVPGLGGIRKARASDPIRGKGKRGGLRYLYLYLQVRQHIHLFYVYGKDEAEDIAQRERQALRRMAEEVLKEGERHA
jgi:hypothetical protein